MAFCKFCGRQLADGEVCTCQGAPAPAPAPQPMYQQPVQPQGQPVYQQPVQPQGQPVYQQPVYQQQGQPVVYVQAPAKQGPDIGAICKNAWSTCLDMLKAPGEKTVEFMQKDNFVNSIIYMVIQAILTGLLLVIMNSKLFAGFMPGKYIFISMLFSLVFSVLLAVVFLLGAMIAGVKTDFKKAMQAASTKAIVSIPLTVVSYIVFLISEPVGLIVFFLGAFASIYFVYEALLAIGTKKTKAIYIGLCISIVMLLLFYFIAIKWYIMGEVGGMMGNPLSMLGGMF